MSVKSDDSTGEELSVHPVLCIIGLATIAGLVGLTAGLPLVSPNHQTYEDPASLNRGDTAWMLISTVLGLFMAPAIAYFYTAANNVKGSKSVQLVLLTGAMLTLVWILFTYSLCYGKDVHRFISSPDTFYMFRNTYGDAVNHEGASTIPSSIFAVYELGFALATPAIIACALGDRVSTFGFLFFILIWHICVYCPIAHMMWTAQGWFPEHYIEDFSGGLVVHMLGAHTAYCAQLFLASDNIHSAHLVTDANAMLKAAFLLWFLWFGFSAGKAHSAGPVAAQSIVNVIGASIASVLCSFFHELIFERNVTPVSVSTALILGLVGITPASGYVTVGGAMVIGIATYLVTITIANQFFYEGIVTNAPLSVVTIHGVGGAVGFFSTACLSYKFINPAAFDGATWGNGWPVLYHAILMCLFYVCSTVVIFLVLYLCDLVIPLKSTADPAAEYPDFALVTENPEDVSGAGAAATAPGGIDARKASLRLASTKLANSRRIEMSRTFKSGKSGTLGTNQPSLSNLQTLASMKSTGLGGVSGFGMPSGKSASKNFRANAMRDLELTQSEKI